MIRCQGFHPVEHECQLDVHRLLTPQRAVVVEHGDPLGRRHEVRPTGCGYPHHEVSDRLFRQAVVPGWKRVVPDRRPRAGEGEERSDQGAEAEADHASGYAWAAEAAIELW
jgi:hypothetical protein